MDLILIRRLMHAYRVIEAQERELATAHIRSSGVLDDVKSAKLGASLFRFKPYLGIRHRHEIRYILRWWLEGTPDAKLTKRERRDLKYVVRCFKPVGLYYSDEPDSSARATAWDTRSEGDYEDFQVAADVQGDLFDAGADQETPAAAAELVGGLELMFQRLGPPPLSSAPKRTVASGGGGYGGK
jgi:hypothetical protein